MCWRALKSSHISRLGRPDGAAFVFLLEHEKAGMLRGYSASIAGRIIHSVFHGARLAKDGYGKPVVIGGPFSISISHSGSCLVVGLATGCVGVDIEFLRYPEKWLTLYHWITAPGERLPAPTERDFLESWTAKESLVKIFGRGLDRGIQSVAIPAVRSMAFRRASVAGRRYWIKPLPRWKEMAVCLALAEPLTVQLYHVTDFSGWCAE